MREQVSANELLKCIEYTQKDLRGQGEDLNEGASRILRKLRERVPGTVVRRAWIRTAAGYAMWDLVTDDELEQRQFRETGAQPLDLTDGLWEEQDTVTYWTSKAHAPYELWVGKPLIE